MLVITSKYLKIDNFTEILFIDNRKFYYPCITRGKENIFDLKNDSEKLSTSENLRFRAKCSNCGWSKASNH